MKRSVRRTVIWIVIVLTLAGFGGLFVFTLMAAPAALTIAEVTVRSAAAREMSASVSASLSALSSAELVNILRDDVGNITMVQTDTLRLNELAAAAAIEAQGRIDALAASDVPVPVGTLVGGPLFSGTGPELNVDIVPMTQATAAFTPEFTSAGINQTRMLLHVAVEAKIELVLGGVRRSVDMSVSVPACDMVIVGDVPQTFLESARDEILNLVN